MALKLNLGPKKHQNESNPNFQLVGLNKTILAKILKVLGYCNL